MKRIRRFLVIAIIGMISILSISCGKKPGTAGSEAVAPTFYLDLTDEGREIIDYANQSLDCEYKLLEEMADPYVMQDFGWMYSEDYIDDDVFIQSYGFIISEENAILRTQIDLHDAPKSSIFGVHEGDSYTESCKKLQDAGFTYSEEETFYSDRKSICFNKGPVNITFNAETKDDNIIESAPIERLYVSVSVRKEPDDSGVMY